MHVYNICKYILSYYVYKIEKTFHLLLIFHHLSRYYWIIVLISYNLWQFIVNLLIQYLIIIEYNNINKYIIILYHNIECNNINKSSTKINWPRAIERSKRDFGRSFQITPKLLRVTISWHRSNKKLNTSRGNIVASKEHGV